MFADIAKIRVKAGRGGDGAVSFHREKYVAAGGPDGGDGGRGGNIVLQVDRNLSTLIDFRYKKNYVAQDGEAGRGKNCFGKNAPDLVIRVPVSYTHLAARLTAFRKALQFFVDWRTQSG